MGAAWVLALAVSAWAGVKVVPPAETAPPIDPAPTTLQGPPALAAGVLPAADIMQAAESPKLGDAVSPRGEETPGASTDQTPLDAGAALFDGVPPEVRETAEALLADYAREGRAAPRLIPYAALRSHDLESLDRSLDWARALLENPALPSYRSTERVSMSDRSSRVLRVRSAGFPGTRYFRPLIQVRPEVARRTYAASRLNDALELDVAPKAELALVDGKPGVLSAEVRGWSGWLQSLRGSWRDPRYADAMAFVFLLGDADASYFNSRTQRGGARRFFDAGEAFQPGLVVTREAARLPKRYTRSFLAKLRALDAVELRARLGPLLTASELEALLFRRDLLLKDAERRGAAALLDQPG